MMTINVSTEAAAQALAGILISDGQGFTYKYDLQHYFGVDDSEVDLDELADNLMAEGISEKLGVRR